MQLQGICSAPGTPLCIVTGISNHFYHGLEYCDKGSLANFIYNISPKLISFQLKLSIIKGIASGLLHLHLEGVVHRYVQCEVNPLVILLQEMYC